LNFNPSFIIPVYNRPQEIDELLASLTQQTYLQPFEVIVVEDGSAQNCDNIIAKYKSKLDLKYFLKQNTGAGLSRNFGMQKASGNYFIVLDSDVLVPEKYLEVVFSALAAHFTDTYGGPDAAHGSFTEVQKAINYAMTSFFTTGGLRGGSNKKSNFQPRSFNMGISKKAFETTQGYSNRKIGEDIELSFKLKKLGFTSQLIPDAFVYHKRRSTFIQFLRQTYLFGKERPLLNKQFPKTKKITYWFPSLFLIGIFFSSSLLIFKCFLPIALYLLYFFIIIIHSATQNKSLKIGFLTIWATLIQFAGYGSGFLKTTFLK
jgi:glycosyltransferase involved in cell wall biosynthesis